ncbi:MAG: ribosomal protein S18-alanine N-acetyltransferase [Eubacteriales bacterium]|nr:ribosomal protein S18-alanine N-acetyltransferase [Eubacteriales bacterium]
MQSEELILIREMTEEDLDTVCEIEKEIFSQPWSRQGFLDALHSEYTRYLCAVKDEELIGYCGYLRSFEEADITNVAVKESARRQNAGKKMLTELIHRGEQDGIEAFTLEVRKSNIPALRLYETLGFASCGVRKNFYDLPKEDAVIMWRRPE